MRRQEQLHQIALCGWHKSFQPVWRKRSILFLPPGAVFPFRENIQGGPGAGEGKHPFGILLCLCQAVLDLNLTPVILIILNSWGVFGIELKLFLELGLNNFLDRISRNRIGQNLDEGLEPVIGLFFFQYANLGGWLSCRKRGVTQSTTGCRQHTYK